MDGSVDAGETVAQELAPHLEASRWDEWDDEPTHEKYRRGRTWK